MWTDLSKLLAEEFLRNQAHCLHHSYHAVNYPVVGAKFLQSKGIHLGVLHCNK